MINEKDNISCRAATVLMSKSMEQELTLKEKAQLAAHLAICKTCVFCSKQLNSIQRTLTHYTESIFKHEPPQDSCLSDEAKTRIHKSITQQTD